MSPSLGDVVITTTENYHVHRAWPRGNDHILLDLTTSDGRRVAGQWFADETEAVAAETEAPSPAHRHGRVLLQPDGADARLRDLPAILAQPGTELVAHRPSRRAVVRHTEGGETIAYTKVVRRSRAADAARRGQWVSDLIDGEIRAPRLLEGSDVERGMLRWSVVPGVTLHDLGTDPATTPESLERAWRAAGRATRALHDIPVQQVEPHHGPQEELGAIRKWVGPAMAHGLLDVGRVERAIETVLEGLAGAPEQGLGVLHRDLHDKQLLCDADGSVGLIDVDTLARGERAVDVANVLAHLELRQLQDLLSVERAAAARRGFLDGVGADRIDPQRLEAYGRATRLRLAAVYAFRPRWRDIAMHLLHHL